MTARTKVAVIGGGVIGLSIGLELSSRHCDVVLLDAKKIGSGTSWTAAGILPPANRPLASDPLDQLRGYSHELYPDWASRLQDVSGIDVQLDRCGGWYLANTAGERALMVGMKHYWDELSIQCQSRTLKQLAIAEPSLSDWTKSAPDAAAWFVEDEYQVRPPRLIKALKVACERQAVRMIEHANVSDWCERENRVSIRIDGEVQNFDRIVIASGVRSGLIADEMQLQKSLIPIRGQMLLLKTPKPLIHSVINLGNRYIVARRDGHTLVGSCEEEVGFDRGTTPETIDSLHQFAAELVPQLESLQPIRSWSGLRPMTFDGFPMIGSLPDHPRTLIATGHYRSGIHMAPATAQAIADLITDRRPAVDLDPFRVGKQQDHR